MTAKEKIIAVISRLDDDVSIEEVINSLNLLRKIEIGLKQVESGDYLDHDEFMKELEREMHDL